MAKPQPPFPPKPVSTGTDPSCASAKDFAAEAAKTTRIPDETPRPRAALKAGNLKRPAALGEPLRGREAPGFSWPFWTGVALTLGWFGAVLAVAFNAGGTVFGLPLTSVALGLSGAVAPPALLWMVIAYLQRASDIRAITEPLRRQLQMVLGTGAQAENRVRRFNDALERQLELLRQAGDGSYDVLQGALQVLQEEGQAIQNLADRSGKEVARLSGVVRDDSGVLEELLRGNGEHFNALATKIAAHIATLDDRADAATQRLSGLVDRLHGLIGEFLVTADRKLASFDSVAAQIGAQEKETAEMARRMAEMLAGAKTGAAELGEILARNQDVMESAGARLLFRMEELGTGTAALAQASDTHEKAFAEKAQSLSRTLANEIAALDTLTGRLEAQISATNDGLTACAADAERKHLRLTEEAAHLLQGLETGVQAMEQSATGAYEKFATASEQVQAQSLRAASHFQTASEQYEKIADRLDQVSGNVVERMGGLSGELAQHSAQLSLDSEKALYASEAAREGVGAALNKLEVMIGRIFDAEARAKTSVGEMNKAYGDALDGLDRRLESFGGEAARHLGALEDMQQRFDDSGARLAARARETEGTWQSLVSAAERQQEVLQQQLRARIEEATGLLNENAVAVESVRDGLYASIEAAFSRAEDIKDELQALGRHVEAPFDEAVQKVRAATSEGRTQINAFMESLRQDASSLTDLNAQLAAQEEKAGHKAAETLAGLDAVAARIEAIQHDNMQATQDVLLRLGALAEQMQARMGDLTTTAEEERKKIAEVVRGMSLEINGLIHDSQTADTRVRIAATMLGEQAGDVRAHLEGQAAAIGGALDQLKGRFAGVAAEMAEISRISESGLEERAENLGQVVRAASASLEGLGGHIDGRTRQLASMQGQLAEGGHVLDQTTQAALDRLSVFTHALVASENTAASTAQQVFARLNEMQDQFARQVTAVSDGSQSITQNMRRAVADLVEQSVSLAAAAGQAESRLGALTGATGELQSQAEAARGAVEEEIGALQKRLQMLLDQIEDASLGLERHTNQAIEKTEGMAGRFEDVSEAAFRQLAEAASQVMNMSDGAMTKVGDLTQALSGQAERVTFAGVHLAELESEVRASSERNAERLTALSAELGAKALYAADGLRLQIEGLKAEADGMLARFEALGQGMARHAADAAGAAGGLEDALNRMQETCLMLGAESKTAARNIAGQTQEFRMGIEGALQGMAAAGDALEKRGDFAIAMVHQMVGRFAEATEGLRHHFDAEANHLKDAGDAASLRLEEFGERLAQHTGRIDQTAETLAASGQQIGETLEKAHFLLRNLSTQTDRVKAGVQDIGDSMLQRLSEMLCAFEDEIKNLSGKAGLGAGELQRKMAELADGLRAEAEAGAAQVEQVFAALPKIAEQNAQTAAACARQALEQLRAQGGQVVSGLQGDMRATLDEAAGRLAGLQEDFRATLAGQVAALDEQLRRVQDHGTEMLDIVRSGATAGSDHAAQVVARLRETAEAEVRAMRDAVGQNLVQMQGLAQRIRDALGTDSEEAAQAAGQVFARLRGHAESELQALLGRAETTLSGLQSACDGLTRDMRVMLGEAEKTAQDFTRTTEDLRQESQRAAGSVADAGHNIAEASALLQKSQGALFDVAQKSGQVLDLFNENLTTQTGRVASLQASIEQVTQSMEQADRNLLGVKDSFENVIGGLTGRLNTGLADLGRQIVSVRGAAQETAGCVDESAETLAARNKAMAQTAGTLAAALAQLDEISRVLSRNLEQSSGAASQQANALEGSAGRIAAASQTASQAAADLSQRLESQAGAIETIAGSLSGRVDGQIGKIASAADALRAPIEQFDSLNARFSTALSLAAQAVDTIPPLSAKAPPAPPAAAASSPSATPPVSPRSMVIQGAARAAPSAPVPPPVRHTQEEAARDMVQRLKEIGAARSAGTPSSAPPPSAKGDADLVASLSQIIQQLEGSASGGSEPAPGRKAK